MAAPPDPAPRAFKAVLPPGQPGLLSADVLVETEGASRSEPAAGFGQDPLHIWDRAEHQAEDHGVEGGIREGQGDGITLHHLHGNPSLQRRIMGSRPHRGVGLERYHPLGGPIQAEVRARPCADLQDLASALLHQAPPMLCSASMVDPVYEPIVAAGIDPAEHTHRWASISWPDTAVLAFWSSPPSETTACERRLSVLIPARVCALSSALASSSAFRIGPSVRDGTMSLTYSLTFLERKMLM